MLTFHNLRAAVALLLFAINTIELAKALLPMANIINESAGGGSNDNTGNSGNNGYENIYTGNGSESNLPQSKQEQQQAELPMPSTIDTEPDHIVIVIGFATLANALSAIILTIMLMWYHRVVEIKKSLGKYGTN